MREYGRKNPERVHAHAAKSREKRRDAQRVAARKHYLKNPEAYKRRARERKLRLIYNLTPEAVEALRQVQNNRCRICGDSFETVKMQIDHDHATGRVRGLLCPHCNHGLGSFRDSIERLASAMHYLSK
jgi:hypothetical protein